MKFFCARNERSLRSAAIFRVILAGGCLLILNGCNQQEPADQPTEPQPMANTNQSPSPAAAPPIYRPPAQAPVIAASQNGGADLKQLNHAYIGWIIQNRQRPKNFEDFVAASGIQVPPAPNGQKYIIDKNGFIALVNQ